MLGEGVFTSERNSNHEQDTGPQKPISGAWVILVGGLQAERRKGNSTVPVRITAANIDAPCCTIVDKRRTNNAPGENTAHEERDGYIETDKYARANESWSEFKIPAPILNGQSEIYMD